MAAHKYIAYHADVQNTYGALLFLGYLVAALVFSLRASLRIYKQFQAQRSAKQPKQRIFLVLALLSFSMLSWNMLSFLILSYSDYTSRHRLHPTMTSPHLWDWMNHSSLFEDFAHALATPMEAWWWTELALLLTYGILLWLTKQCTDMHISSLQPTDAKRNIPVRLRKVDGLGDLVAISQILPISFTLNLAFLMLLGAKLLKSEEVKQSSQRQSVASGVNGRSGVTAQVGFASAFQTGFVLAFLCALNAVPNMFRRSGGDVLRSHGAPHGHPALLPLVLFIRMLMPSLYSGPDADSANLALFTILIMSGLTLQVKDTLALSKAGPDTAGRLLAVLISGHPSPRTLGQDAVLAIISIVAWVVI